MAIIEVEHLTKWYGSTAAINDISFSVECGEIVGFLGRNGAGKTTTMRILAGSLGATEGTAKIGGFDVAHHPERVKRLVGYLPEVPPLYTDMTVRGYLQFAAKLKQISSVKTSVEEVIEQTGLREVSHRIIDHLSKGFRQRVGLAQALVHRPPVLILDEPMSGLDPMQRQEMLSLIQMLARHDTTIVLSTHVLAEIESLCHRVIIIDKGRIRAQDTMENLSSSDGGITLRIARLDATLFEKLTEIPGVQGAFERNGEVIVRADRDVREAVAKVAVDYGLWEMRPERGLQDIFVRLLEEDT